MINPLIRNTLQPPQKKAQPVWYRQFWPWFLIALPLSVVIAGFSTLFIALENPHSMVDDQYYQEGLAINQSLDQDRRAAVLAAVADVTFEPFQIGRQARVEVTLSGLSDYPAEITLLLLHPGSQALDQTLLLTPIAVGQYGAALTQQYQHRYYLRILPSDKSWRLNGEIDFRDGRATAVSRMINIGKNSAT